MNGRVRFCLLATLVPAFVAAADRDEVFAAQARAETALTAADRDGARERAPATLDVARTHARAGAAAVARRAWTDARRAWEKAEADARLAAARSRQLRAETTSAELEEAVATLRTEIVESGE